MAARHRRFEVRQSYDRYHDRGKSRIGEIETAPSENLAGLYRFRAARRWGFGWRRGIVHSLRFEPEPSHRASSAEEESNPPSGYLATARRQPRGDTPNSFLNAADK